MGVMQSCLITSTVITQDPGSAVLDVFSAVSASSWEGVRQRFGNVAKVVDSCCTELFHVGIKGKFRINFNTQVGDRGRK